MKENRCARGYRLPFRIRIAAHFTQLLWQFGTKAFISKTAHNNFGQNNRAIHFFGSRDEGFLS